MFLQFQIPLLSVFLWDTIYETYSRMNTFGTYSRKEERMNLIFNWNNNQPNIIRNKDNKLNFILTTFLIFMQKSALNWVKIEKNYVFLGKNPENPYNFTHYPYTPYIFLVKIKNIRTIRTFWPPCNHQNGWTIGPNWTHTTQGRFILYGRLKLKNFAWNFKFKKFLSMFIEKYANEFFNYLEKTAIWTLNKAIFNA